MPVDSNNPALAAHDPATLAALNRRTALLTVIILPAIVLTILLVVSQSRATRVADLAERSIPTLLKTPTRTWTSSSMKFSDEELDILETRDYVYRTYTDGQGSPVDLCVIFSEDNRKGTHPPDVCLEGSGSRVLSRHDRAITLQSTPVMLRELVTISPTGQYVYYAYFYKCGDVFTPSFYKQQVQIIWNGLLRRNASGALVRYSTPMANASDLEHAQARADQLVAASFPYIRDGLNVPR